MFGRHQPLANDAWNELAFRAAIAKRLSPVPSTVFHPDMFWPAHPSDDGDADGYPSFYWGAAGVISALDYLHRIDAARVAADFRPVLPKLLERALTVFESNSPTDYAKHGSLPFGDVGAALVVMRLAPTSTLADLVRRPTEANLELPIRGSCGACRGR